MRKGCAGCAVFFFICLCSMSGSALFMYALLSPELSHRAVLIVCSLACLAVPVLFLIRLSALRRRLAALQPVSVPPFPDAASVTYDAITERVLPLMQARFQNGFPIPVSGGGLFESLIWPFWFIETIGHCDAGELDSLLRADKDKLDFLCDRLFAVGMEEAARKLQYYRASPAADEQALEFFRSRTEDYKQQLVRYVQQQLNEQ